MHFPRPPRPGLILSLLLVMAAGCTGFLQNLGARWVTRQIATEFNMDEAQTAATRASVDRLIEAAPGALASKVDMLVATVDTAIAKGLTEKKLLGMERQVDDILDIVAKAIIDEASPSWPRSGTTKSISSRHASTSGWMKPEKRSKSPRKSVSRSVRTNFVDAVEDWAGSLTDGQEAALRKYVAGLPDESAARLGADERRVERVAAISRTHPSSEVIRETLWKEWKNREDWGPEARPPAARRAEGRQALLFVYGMLDAKQKDHASKHLHELHDKITSFFGTAGT